MMQELLTDIANEVWHNTGNRDYWPNFMNAVRERSSDRRYTVKLRAAVCGARPSGIFTYRNAKYDLYHYNDTDTIDVTRMM